MELLIDLTISVRLVQTLRICFTKESEGNDKNIELLPIM